MQAKQQSFVTDGQEVGKESNPRMRFEFSPVSPGVEVDAASYSAVNVATRIIGFRNRWLLHGYPENQLCKLWRCIYTFSLTHRRACTYTRGSFRETQEYLQHKMANIQQETQGEPIREQYPVACQSLYHL